MRNRWIWISALVISTLRAEQIPVELRSFGGTNYNVAIIREWEAQRIPGPRPLPMWVRIDFRITGFLGDAVVGNGSHMEVDSYSSSGRYRTTHYRMVEDDDLCVIGIAPAKRIIGTQLSNYAVKVGTTNWGSYRIPVYSFGDLPVAAGKEKDPVAEQQKADKKTKAIVEFLKKRTEDGSADAPFDLGLRHVTGDGVERSQAEARRLIAIAAARGNANAANWLSTNTISKSSPLSPQRTGDTIAGPQ